METDSDRKTTEALAASAWLKLTADEKACVRFGMIPYRIIEEFGIAGADDSRDFSVAMMCVAKANGGMVA